MNLTAKWADEVNAELVNELLAEAREAALNERAAIEQLRREYFIERALERLEDGEEISLSE